MVERCSTFQALAASWVPVIVPFFFRFCDSSPCDSCSLRSVACSFNGSTPICWNQSTKAMNLFKSGGTTPTIRSGEQRRAQDLDLRLGRPKNSTLPSTRSRSQTITIVVEDDDDDVQIFSPRSVAQAKTSSSSRHQHITDLTDEDLELRLGLAGTEGSGVRICSGNDYTAIDLTSTVYSDHEVLPRTIGKRKQSMTTSESSKELKLTCAICMDTVKEEMSTICGHIFCRVCIMEAFQVQKKWPTCRRRLTNSQIHRIYLPCSSN